LADCVHRRLSDGWHHPRRDRRANQNAEREHGNGNGYSHRPTERPELAVIVSGHGVFPDAAGGRKHDNCGRGTVGADVPASAVTSRSSGCGVLPLSLSMRARRGTRNLCPLLAPRGRDTARIEFVGDGLQRCRAARSNLYNDRRKRRGVRAARCGALPTP
jgi:hypothetical protein